MCVGSSRTTQNYICVDEFLAHILPAVRAAAPEKSSKPPAANKRSRVRKIGVVALIDAG